MDLPARDAHLPYLILTLALIVAAGTVHNLSLADEDLSFAMCDVTVGCEGVQAGDYCLGVQARSVSCIDPRNASTVQWAEAECALDAQGLCNANPDMTGMAWTDHPNATYDGRTCSSWADEPEVTLLACEDTFDDVTQWTDGTADTADGTDGDPTVPQVPQQ